MLESAISLAMTLSGLTPGNVDVWMVPLGQPAAVIEHCVSLLSDVEVERARRFVTADLRSRSVVGRGLLRYLMSRYTKVNPVSLEIASGPYGKPFIAGSPWEFNVSHSGARMACAVSYGVALGIDIEMIRELSDALAIAERYFAPAEVERLNLLASEYRRQAFFECWTRKEAFIKATGYGMSQRLDSFEVGFGPGVKAELLRLDAPAGLTDRWSLHNFDPGPGYCGALAARAQNAAFTLREFRVATIGPPTGLQVTQAKQELLASLR